MKTPTTSRNKVAPPERKALSFLHTKKAEFEKKEVGDKLMMMQELHGVLERHGMEGLSIKSMSFIEPGGRPCKKMKCIMTKNGMVCKCLEF